MYFVRVPYFRKPPFGAVQVAHVPVVFSYQEKQPKDEKGQELLLAVRNTSQSEVRLGVGCA